MFNMIGWTHLNFQPIIKDLNQDTAKKLAVSPDSLFDLLHSKNKFELELTNLVFYCSDKQILLLLGQSKFTIVDFDEGILISGSLRDWVNFVDSTKEPRLAKLIYLSLGQFQKYISDEARKKYQ